MSIYFIYVTFGSLKEARALGGKLVKIDWQLAQTLYRLFIQHMYGKTKLEWIENAQ